MEPFYKHDNLMDYEDEGELVRPKRKKFLGLDSTEWCIIFCAASVGMIPALIGILVLLT